ncbi:MAG: TrmH family RNA methyltransferase [Candidatus Blackburnbacteria bacterium]|nr:TrmH family RNA methyltransferase [Candidatus Blackburnbacteria bacterium]
MLKLNAKELRDRKPTKEELASVSRLPIYIVLDNVLDTYNIGGIFRLAEAVTAQEVILCGESETPPSSRIHKAAVGTEEWVPWRYEPTAQEALQKLQETNSKIQIVVVEQSEKSVPHTEIGHLALDIENSAIAVVVGHETEGVSKEVLDMADIIIPMFGVNKSLNVIVSVAIVTYKVLEQMTT